MRRISLGTRDELLEAGAARYRAATRREKGHILTEFVEISGYHSKHAERLIRREHAVDRSRPRPERRVCYEAVREALIVALHCRLRGGNAIIGDCAFDA